MPWFKRWYHERYVNRARDNMQSILCGDVRKRRQRKVIRIIYSGCNRNSIVCRHRNSFWFIRKRRLNRSIVTSSANCAQIDTADSNRYGKQRAQVTDKVHRVITSDRQSDTHTSYRQFYGSEEFDRRKPVSFVTDVNQYGNGENDCDSLSKSKDSRLRTFKLSIVPEICCSICNPAPFDVKQCIESDPNRIEVQYDSDGPADTDEWPPKPFQQIEFLQRRINELEYFIADIETRVKSSDQNTCRVCDDQRLTDWVIVSIELKSIRTSCESLSDDEHLSSCSASSSIVQYYTTSEFRNKQTVVTVHQCPTDHLLSDRELYEFSRQSEYGTFHSHNCMLERLLCCLKFLDFNIKTGTPSSDLFPADSSCSSRSDSTMKFTSISLPHRSDFQSSDSVFLKDPMYPEFNYLLQEPCSSSKHSNMLTAQMIHNSFSSISSMDSLKSSFHIPTKCYSIESIPEYFGLNECGDIIIHIDHICEEKGFGFLMGRKKKLYCDVPTGEEVYETPKFSLKFAVKRFFSAMSDTFCKCTTVVGESSK